MKLVIAIIQPHKLDAVKAELYKREINLLTVNEVLGHGRQMGITEVYRGVKEMGNLLRKVQLLIAVNEDFVQPTIDAILRGGRTGDIGDGKIFVLPHRRTGRNGHWVRSKERSYGVRRSAFT